MFGEPSTEELKSRVAEYQDYSFDEALALAVGIGPNTLNMLRMHHWYLQRIAEEAQEKRSRRLGLLRDFLILTGAMLTATLIGLALSRVVF